MLVVHPFGFTMGLQEGWKLLALVALGVLQVGWQPQGLEESWLCVAKKKQHANISKQLLTNVIPLPLWWVPLLGLHQSWHLVALLVLVHHVLQKSWQILALLVLVHHVLQDCCGVLELFHHVLQESLEVLALLVLPHHVLAQEDGLLALALLDLGFLVLLDP